VGDDLAPDDGGGQRLLYIHLAEETSPQLLVDRLGTVAAALLRSASASSSRLLMAMPMLAVTWAEPKGIVTAGRTAPSTVAASWLTAASLGTRSHTITKLSPPYRATVSPACTAFTNRAASSARTVSPTTCPYRSFTTLKASRSSTIAATCSLVRAALRRA
jgi:hypothetical protein